MHLMSFLKVLKKKYDKYVMAFQFISVLAFTFVPFLTAGTVFPLLILSFLFPACSLH